MEKAAKSSIMTFIRSELSERPEEQRTGEAEQQDEQEKALEDFEEEHFVRIPMSRKDKALMKRKRHESGDLLNVRTPVLC